MSYGRAKLQMIEDGIVSMHEIDNVETVGTQLVIHRRIERNTIAGVSEETAHAAGVPAYVATGDTWTVSLKFSGIRLVSGIRTRAQARRIARRLTPDVETFKDAVLRERDVAGGDVL